MYNEPMPGSLEKLKLVQDKSAKSESYYAGGEVVVDDAVIAWLKEKLAASAGNTVRICLHRDAAAPFHEMIIAHKKAGAFKPHKHLSKDESSYVLEGKLRVKTFKDGGALAEERVLGPKGSGLPFMQRMPAGVWHSTEPEGELVVFHESKLGPFVAGDNVYPEWA
jgi:cupin fold WbuC family metalloprotein